MQTPDHLLNAHYQDRYFDVVNAIAEAHHVYFEGCQLLSHLKAQQGRLKIGETGFGAGRVLLALIDFLAEQASHNPPESPWQIEFASVELHPLSPERLADLLNLFRPVEPGSSMGRWIDSVTAAYSQFDLSQFHGWQEQVINTPFATVTLRLWLGEALEMLTALESKQDLRDLWFLEGHGPKANPEIWRPEILQAVGRLTRVGGHCATFTVAGELRRELREAGFKTDRLPGIGGKKQVLRGTRRELGTGQREALQVVAYRPEWILQFQTLASEIRQACQLKSPELLLGIAHIGSTSVPGLAAKPILDIDLIISSRLHLPEMVQILTDLGYIHQGDKGIPGREAFADSTQSTRPSHHLYLCAVDSAPLHQHLLLRDYLRNQPERAAAYGQLKQDLAKRYPHDRSAYTGAKTQLINRLLAEARTSTF